MAIFTVASLSKNDLKLDNLIFQLHYKLTSPILLITGLSLLIFQQFTTRINCNESQYVDNYCWLNPTLEPENRDSSEPRQPFYQWTWLILCSQALFFYIPRYIWKTIERGRIKHVCDELSKHCGQDEYKNITTVAGKMNDLAIGLFSCELLNLINAFVQFSTLAGILSSSLPIFGSSVKQYGYFKGHSETNDSDYAYGPFPRMVRCLMLRKGASGDLQKHDFACVLPLNLINEKVFDIVWIWLLLLVLLSGLAVVYRIVLIASVQVQALVLSYYYESTSNAYKLLKNRSIGESVFYLLLGKNLSPVAIRKLLLTDEASEKL